jgi:hypothetical protein
MDAAIDLLNGKYHSDGEEANDEVAVNLNKAIRV